MQWKQIAISLQTHIFAFVISDVVDEFQIDCFIFDYPETGVIASGNFNGNNSSIVTIENSTSIANKTHYIGTINELVASETIQSDGNANHVVAATLSSLSLTLNTSSDSDSTVPSIHGALSRASVPNASTLAAAPAAVTTSSPSSSTPTQIQTSSTTVTPATSTEVTSRMQTSQFIGASNAQRDSPSAASTLPITTNKPREYIRFKCMI